MCKDYGDFEMIQYGLTSYGGLCGNRETPGIYTYLVYYRDWIDEQIGKNESTTPGTGTTRPTTFQSTETSTPITSFSDETTTPTTFVFTETPTAITCPTVETPAPITCPTVETPAPITCPTVETPTPITCPTVETPTPVTCTCPSVETSRPTLTTTTSASETTDKPDHDSQVYPPWYVPKDKEYVTQCCRTVNVSTSQISRAVVKGITKIAIFYSIY